MHLRKPNALRPWAPDTYESLFLYDEEWHDGLRNYVVAQLYHTPIQRFMEIHLTNGSA